MLSLLDKALALAATGIPVFPCRSTPHHKPTDKTPTCRHGLNDASTDPDTIRELFSHCEAKLIGVPTGPKSGFDVLDLDPRHGSDEWEKANTIPATRIHTTQSGGKHVFFKSTGVKMPNSQSKIAPGLDVRGDGGFVVWWPAFGCEVWLETDIAPWPAALDAVARAPKARTPRVARITRAVNAPTPDAANQALADAVKVIEAAIEGERHETIRDVCMAMASLVLGDFLGEGEVHDAIIAAADVCGAEDMDNVEKLWSSAMEKASPAEVNTGDELGPLPDLEEPEDADLSPDWWLGELIRGKQDKDGNPGPILANLHNAFLYFRFHPEWRGRLKLNEFSTRTEIDGRNLKDPDGRAATVTIQKYGIGVNSSVAMEAMLAAGERAKHNPLRDMLRSFKWDGVSRLDTWLIDYAGAADNSLTRAFGAKTMIASVARVIVPGCKVDTVLILEGPQGVKKSSLFETLAFKDDWFLGDIGDIKSKEGWARMQGRFWIEFAELDHVNRNDVGSMKAFLSRRVDVFRSPYGKLDDDHPRQGLIVGTINPGSTGYLKDDTGGRRFWPVPVAVNKPEGWKINLAGLKRDREQLYAEAVVRFDVGEAWYLDTDRLEAMQRAVTDERAEVDPWRDIVASYLSDKHTTTIPDVLAKAINMKAEMFRKTYSNQAAAILKALGWEVRNIRVGGAQSRRYVSPEWIATGGACNVVNIRPTTLAELSA